MVTPPVITYQSQPTNILCIYGNYFALTATATAPGQSNGFPLTYQWQFNGTNISGATNNSYNSFTTNSPGTYTLVVANAAGSTNASWIVANTNAINVTKDLLLIYNTNSVGSTVVENYYLAHRPLVSGAKVLGIGCTNSEIVSSVSFSNQVLAPYLNWLANNPTKHPQYIVLFLDIPSRVEDAGIATYPGVQYQLAFGTPPFQPYMTSINMNGTNNCIGYINKLATIGVLASSNNPVLSASAAGYGNTNYVVDDVNNLYCGDPWVPATTNGLLAAGVSLLAFNILQDVKQQATCRI